MGRQPDGTSTRSEVIHVRLTDAALGRIDELRGSWTRSEYVRRALALAVKEKRQGPPKVDW